ncbi:MAG TPA: phosphatase PAP2 family protein [Thermoanaerobaculia bacterium]|nr:phosphatase PAP2 family protein [Thermoanaerobaculia bacterium]
MIILAFIALYLLLWGLMYVALPLLERLLARAANRVAKFRYFDYLPVALLLVIGVVAAMAAGDAFTDLAELVHANSPQLQQIDSRVHDWAAHERTTGSTLFFTTMTIIGLPGTLAVLLAIVAGLLFWRKRWRWATYLLFTCGVGALLNVELKLYFARARPELAEALRHAHGYSFPSGHAMGSTIVFGSLAYLAFRIIKPWFWRAAAVALALTLIVAISASRIYLGVHWISDVAAGVSAGFLWLTAATVAYETSRRIRMIRALRARKSQ